MYINIYKCDKIYITCLKIKVNDNKVELFCHNETVISEKSFAR